MPQMEQIYNRDGGLINTGDFLNLNPSVYWSGTEFASDTVSAWVFNFGTGGQDVNDKDFNLFVLAVRSGDVAAVVPEPTTIALLGIGLAGIAVYGVRRKRQRRYKES